MEMGHNADKKFENICSAIHIIDILDIFYLVRIAPHYQCMPKQCIQTVHAKTVLLPYLQHLLAYIRDAHSALKCLPPCPDIIIKYTHYKYSMHAYICSNTTHYMLMLDMGLGLR